MKHYNSASSFDSSLFTHRLPTMWLHVQTSPISICLTHAPLPVVHRFLFRVDRLRHCLSIFPSVSPRFLYPTALLITLCCYLQLSTRFTCPNTLVRGSVSNTCAPGAHVIDRRRWVPRPPFGVAPIRAKCDVIHETGSTLRNTTPPEEDRATATGGSAHKMSCWSVQRFQRHARGQTKKHNRHTDRLTDKRVEYNTPHPYRGGVIKNNGDVFSPPYPSITVTSISATNHIRQSYRRWRYHGTFASKYFTECQKLKMSVRPGWQNVTSWHLGPSKG